MSFTPTNALPQIPAIQRAVDPETGKISAEWLRWLNLVKQRTDYLSVEGIIDARTIIDGTITVSTLPALSTMTGQITYAQMPPGAGTWAASPTISGDVTISANLLPSNNDTSDLGSATKQFRRGYISEINAVLFSKQTQQLYGGWLAVSKNAGTFKQAVLSTDTAIDFGQAMTLNQFVLVRATDAGGAIAEEYIKVGALVGDTYYNVTRNLSGAGAKNWPVSTPYQVRGVAGDGWIELNAFDTPRMSVFSQGSAYNNSTELIRIGHLAGMPNSSSGIGFYAGDATNYIRWDGTTFKVVGADCVIDNSGLTLNSTTLFAAGGAVKFKRDGSYGAAGASDVFAVWAEGAGGSYQNIYLENFTHRSGADTKASAYLRATGWDGGGGNVAATPATVRCQSEPGGVSAIVLTANTISASSGLFERSRSVRMGEWTTYVGSWKSGGLNVTVGNATFVSQYTMIGKTVFYRITIVYGSTTVDPSPGSAWVFGLPQTASAGGLQIVIGRATAQGAATFRSKLAAELFSTTTFLVADETSALTNAYPFAWAAGNALWIQGFYEMA